MSTTTPSAPNTTQPRAAVPCTTLSEKLRALPLDIVFDGGA